MELDRLDVTAQPVLIRYLGKDRPERYPLLEIFSEHDDRIPQKFQNGNMCNTPLMDAAQN